MPNVVKPKAKDVRSKTKVKSRGRHGVPIIDQVTEGNIPVPMSRYISLETKASRTGPFKVTR